MSKTAPGNHPGPRRMRRPRMAEAPRSFAVTRRARAAGDPGWSARQFGRGVSGDRSEAPNHCIAGGGQAKIDGSDGLRTPDRSTVRRGSSDGAEAQPSPSFFPTAYGSAKPPGDRGLHRFLICGSRFAISSLCWICGGRWPCLIQTHIYRASTEG